MQTTVCSGQPEGEGSHSAGHLEQYNGVARPCGAGQIHHSEHADNLLAGGRKSERYDQEGRGQHVQKEVEELRQRVLEAERVTREAERSREEAMRELELERMRLEQAVRRAREDGSVRLAALEDSVRSLASRSDLHKVQFFALPAWLMYL